MIDPLYLVFLRSKPCTFCGHKSDAPHHLRHVVGVKRDELAIPICTPCHMNGMHGAGMEKWLQKHKLTAVDLAEEVARNLCEHFQNERRIDQTPF